MKKIETKIAKNGTKMYYVEGKRVSREIAIQTAADNRGGAFIINREKRTSVYSVVSYVESGTYTSTDTYEFNKIYFKTTYNGTELWVNPNTEKFGQVVFESYNKEFVKDVAAAIEAAFISGEKGVTVKVNGTVEILTDEADPDNYAVSQEALEVATNAEIEAMKVAREERIKAAQKEVADYIAKIDEQEKQEKVAAFERELAEYYAERELANNEHVPEYKYYIKSRRPIAGAVPKGYISATEGEMKAYSLCTDGSVSRVPRKVVFGVAVYDHPLSDEQIINYDLHVDPRNPNSIIKGSENDKEETQMTIEIPAEGKHEFTIGDDTVCFFNGKFHSVFSLKYHMAIVRDLVGIRHHCIFDADETELYDVATHETSYDNFMEILHQRGNREKLLALRKDYSITDRLSANNNHMWYVNGKRSGQVKVYNLLETYGLTIAEFLAEDEAYINERIAAGAARIAIEDQANFLKDKIARDAKPCDDNDDVFNLIPAVDAFDDEQPTIRDKYWQARAWLNRTISKSKEYWFLFGRRVKKDSVDVAAYLYDYGLTPDKFATEDQKVIDEEQRELAIRWANWQKKWFAEYLADKIKRDSKSYDDSDVVFKFTPDDDDDDDELIDPPVDSTLTADIAKYQAAFDEARQISIRAGSGFCKINGEQIWFNYGELRGISSDRYNGEITFDNGRKRFRYRGIVIKRADFLNRMNNEVITVDQKETFAEFCDDYQSPDTGYFAIRIFPKFANGTESSFHATANDFDHALELVELFKTLDLPFIGTIKRNQVSGEEYYRHNRDGSETVNPPQPKLPDNIKDSLQRGMKAALEQYRRCNLSHNQAGANRERECFLICKKAFREVA